MKDDIYLSCPKCGAQINLNEAGEAKRLAVKMGENALLEISEKFRGFYQVEYQESKRGYEHFYGVSCRVCESVIIKPVYVDDVFVSFEFAAHSEKCPVGDLEINEFARKGKIK